MTGFMPASKIRVQISQANVVKNIWLAGIGSNMCACSSPADDDYLDSAVFIKAASISAPLPPTPRMHAQGRRMRGLLLCPCMRACPVLQRPLLFLRPRDSLLRCLRRCGACHARCGDPTRTLSGSASLQTVRPCRPFSAEQQRALWSWGTADPRGPEPQPDMPACALLLSKLLHAARSHPSHTAAPTHAAAFPDQDQGAGF